MALSVKHPAPQRIFHTLNLWGILMLLCTGFLLHWTPVGINMGLVRFIHVTAGFSIAALGVIRIYYSFAGRWADWREFWPGMEHLRKLPATLGYYLLLRSEHPQEGTYNPLQRLAYLGILILVAVQGWLGIMLVWPDKLAPGTSLLQLHSFHYAICWLVVSFMIVHIYMVLTETREYLPAMMFGLKVKDSKYEKKSESAA